MPSLISCHELSKTFRESPLFEGVSLNVSSGDRIGIIGANGSGKTTLLKILAEIVSTDEGERLARKDLRIGYVPQDQHFDPDHTVMHVVLSAARAWAAEMEDETEVQVRASTILSKMGFEEPGKKVNTLSGGWQKRLAIAAALVIEPEVLLLDEPTNHLDIEGIIWLESLLASARFAFVVISHDRAFLQKITNRVMELDRRYPNGLLNVEGDYSTFLEKRDALLIAQTKQQESLSVKVRNEVQWLRSGVKARTSKARARIDEAHRLIEELKTMKQKAVTGKAGIDFLATGRKTKRLLAGAGITKSMGGQKLFHDIDLLLRPKLRVGLVGGNGSGKTTLLKILAGELEPDEGKIDLAEHLKIVYFDQQREELDLTLTLRQALAGKGDTVIFKDRPIHVGAWAARFRFETRQLDMPIATMSGGERAKILIARLMLRPADILLLDEPTNDLDIPTLEVMEESLSDFPGALVLVTHDRYMLDRISNVILGLDGKGGTGFFADYDQWRNHILEQKKESESKGTETKTPPKPKSGPNKLSYIEQREYDGLEEKIEQAEAEMEAKEQALQDPALASDAEELAKCYEAHRQAQEKLEQLMERWVELEDKKEKLEKE